MQKVTIEFVKNYLTKRLIYDFTLDDECSEVEREILMLYHAEFSGVVRYLKEFTICRDAFSKLHPKAFKDSGIGNPDDKEYHRILKDMSIAITQEVNNRLKERILMAK